MKRLASVLLLPALVSACHRKDAGQSTSSGVSATSAPSAAPTARVKVVTDEEVQRVTNPGQKAPYAGPMGTVAGVVRISGDSSPPLDLGDAKIPLGDCFEAHEMYKSLFREGPGRGLADALVAVTGYEGYKPVPAQSVAIEAKGCAYDQRTAVMMFGQTLSVANRGKAAVTPQLLGSKSQALLVAIPGGDPIELTPQKIGLHKLVDRSHEFAFTDVYVVPYPTVTVTGKDGRFEIPGVPVGTVKVNALLPSTGQTVEREVTVEANSKVELVLELNFDQSKFKRAVEAASATTAPPPSAAATATAPATSAP